MTTVNTNTRPHPAKFAEIYRVRPDGPSAKPHKSTTADTDLKWNLLIGIIMALIVLAVGVLVN